MLWANLHLLFWLSLIPFTTGWMGENEYTAAPTALYGVVLLMAAVAYSILVSVILRVHGKDAFVARALGRDVKGKVSLLLYAIAVACSFFVTPVALTIYVIVALIWLVPDRRIEGHPEISAARSETSAH